MKLLLITDSLFILSKFSSKNDLYYFGDIQVDCIYLGNIEAIQKVKTIIAERRYHLILSLTKSNFQGEFIQHETIVNSINHYWNSELEFDKNIIDKLHTEPSIVNRSTSYFNIFLEIPKAVSANENIKAIKRIDVISPYNYYLAKLFIDAKSNFYLLNYTGEYPIKELEDLLTKLE